MGLRPILFFNSFCAGTIFRRQILTSKDAPRSERVKTVLSSLIWWDLIFMITWLKSVVETGPRSHRNNTFLSRSLINMHHSVEPTWPKGRRLDSRPWELESCVWKAVSSDFIEIEITMHYMSYMYNLYWCRPGRLYIKLESIWTYHTYIAWY